jgi:two-component system, OmpR family, sensor kinase
VIWAQAPAQAVRVPGQGLEFQVQMKDGQTLYIQLPPPTARRAPAATRRRSLLAAVADRLRLAAGPGGLAVALGAYPSCGA